MSLKLEHTILLVDDEQSILQSLQRLFRKQKMKILIAESGLAGLEILKKHHKQPVSLIISDQRMPGMAGTEFLEKSIEFAPDAAKFLLTGYSDIDAVIEAVNKGKINKYLTKPWKNEELLMHVIQSLEQYELKEENKRLLELTKKQTRQLFEFGKKMGIEVKEKTRELEEKTRELEFSILNTVRAFASLSELHMPENREHGKRVSEMSLEISKRMNLSEEEKSKIEIAGVLHDIGKIGLSAEIISSSKKKLSEKDRKKLNLHPVSGEQIVGFIGGLDDAGKYIRHHHEKYDGSGYPDAIAGSDIPVGARILAVADNYDKITYLGIDKEKYIELYLKAKNITSDIMSDEDLLQQATIFHFSKYSSSRYDPDIVEILFKLLKDEGVIKIKEKAVPISELIPGMIITRSLFGRNNTFLLPNNTTITDNIIRKLKLFFKNNEIENKIIVLDRQELL